LAPTSGRANTKCALCGVVVHTRPVVILPPQLHEGEGKRCEGSCDMQVSHCTSVHPVVALIPFRVCRKCGYVDGAAMDRCHMRRASGRPAPVVQQKREAAKRTRTSVVVARGSEEEEKGTSEGTQSTQQSVAELFPS